MTRPIEPMPHYHQLRRNHWANLLHRDPPPEPEVDEPNPDDGLSTMDDYTPPTVWQDTDGDVVSESAEPANENDEDYDPELNMNQDAPISYWEGHDTHEEAEGLR